MTRKTMTTLGAVVAALPAAAGELPVTPLTDALLQDLRWQARPVVILGRPERVRDQIAAFQAASAALADREVVLLTDGPDAARLRDGSDLQVLLIGKDGGVKMSEAGMVDPDRIIGLIDAMPMRRRETR